MVHGSRFCRSVSRKTSHYQDSKLSSFRFLCSSTSARLRAWSRVSLIWRAIPLTSLFVLLAYYHVPTYHAINVPQRLCFPIPWCLSDILRYLEFDSFQCWTARTHASLQFPHCPTYSPVGPPNHSLKIRHTLLHKSNHNSVERKPIDN